MDILSAFAFGLIPAFLLVVFLTAIPSILLLGFIGLAVVKHMKTALRPAATPASVTKS